MKLKATVLVATRAARAGGVLVLPVAFGACTWFTDFKRQPKIDPWEPLSQNDADSLTPPRGQPKYSVPIGGGTAPAAYMISYNPLPGVIDSFSVVPNPVPVDERSVENGRKNFQINCAVCHGVGGKGNPKAAASGIIGINLINERVGGFKDGYIYGMMRNGRGMMPSYNRIEEHDRWDIINYIRTLQGQTQFKPDSSPAGYPGQNGTTVPGYTATAPTLPAPYLRPTPMVTPGSSNVNSATYRGGNDAGAAPHVVGGETKPAGEAAPKAGTPDSKEKH